MIVNELTSIDFIRIHYLSFIKLYNKNLMTSMGLVDVNNILLNLGETDNEKITKIKSLIREIYNGQTYLQVIIGLCKLHLKCLFYLAKNRNTDVFNKFYQLQIVEFLSKELDLEHEVSILLK